jgi:hypothetical protein
MQAVSIRIFLILTILTLLNPSSLLAAPEQRTALVIGNSTYSSGPLKNPVNDATDMAAALKRLGFHVTLHKNANQQTMENAIREFGRGLKRERGVGLFYYAGHGMQIGGVNYLIPVGARVEKEIDVKFQAVNAEMILAEMENAENGMNIVLLDACRDNPFGRSFRSASRGLAIISNAPTGSFISYSTGANQLAKDGEGRNSPYTKSLLANIDKPGLTINRVFMNVRSRVMKETGQVPWELSSLVGDFYFRPGSVSESTSVTIIPVIDYAAERRKVEEEQELLRQKTALEEAKRKLEEDKQQLAMSKRPPAPTVREIGRDGRFIAYDNGTVLDTKTNLMWAAKDHGSNINWQGAKNYCENYRGGGYTDWRMPTHDELAGLYDESKTYKTPFGDNAHLTELIRLTSNWVWASETRGSDATKFNFFFYFFGARNTHPQSSDFGQALPVRSVASGPKETRRDDRFIAYDDGTVLDTKTNLVWAAKDNGRDINWGNAKSYCENYRGGGYTDWRMPTLDELAGLYVAKPNRHGYQLSDLIDITASPWSTGFRGFDAASFDFHYGGQRKWIAAASDYGQRAFPVRSSE